jgi:hypothetical protein
VWGAINKASVAVCVYSVIPELCLWFAEQLEGGMLLRSAHNGRKYVQGAESGEHEEGGRELRKAC